MMAEVIAIAALFVLIVIETIMHDRDNARNDVQLSACRAENERLQAENKKLRGDLLMKQADEFARDCK